MEFKLTLGIACLIGLCLASIKMTHAEQDQDGHFLQEGPQVMEDSASMATRSTSRSGQESHQEEKVGEEGQPGKDPFTQVSEYAKLMLNPVALVKKISHDFQLPKNKLIEKVGKGLIFGTEALFSPVIACLKIIEKVFRPDACRLKYVCQFGSRLDFMKETIFKLSPNFLEGSSHLKALSYGITGRDCAQTFADCDPTLQDSYKDLKEDYPKQDDSKQDY